MPTDGNPATVKAAMRAQARRERSRFAADHRGVSPLLPPSEWLRRVPPGAAIASYRPMGGEIDPVAIETQLASAGHPVAFPRVTQADAPLRFHHAPSPADWEAGPHAILQPMANTAPVSPALILVPLLAFTRSGARLGQGGGYYDRTFAARSDAIRIGFAYAGQQVERLALQDHDIRLHGVLTETGYTAFA